MLNHEKISVTTLSRHLYLKIDVFMLENLKQT